MKKLLTTSLCIIMYTFCFSQEVVNLRTEHLVNPMSIDTKTPRLGWQIQSDKKDVMQKEYHIIVASTREKAEKCEGDLWDITQKSDQSQWVKYEGKALRSNTRCYWRVRVKTTKGTSQWSDVAMWNVGLLTESDWQGQWIGLDHAMPWDVEDVHSRLSARYLRTTFDIDKPIRQATLYISGLGMYECFINGKKVGDQVLAPAPTDYRKTVLYNAFDVTDLCTVGQRQALAVVLGNGRYYTMQQKKKAYKIANFGYPTLRANLIIEYADGRKKVISTNDKWRLNPDGPIRSNNEYDGEIYDANKEFSNWTMPEYDDSQWQNAERSAIPYGTLRGAMAENMKILKTLNPISMVEGKLPNSKCIDFGQNTAGWVNFHIVKAQKGDTIQVRYAEKLKEDGTLYTANLRNAQTTDYYICNGKENDLWWSPRFSYHGFRYTEITVIPTTNDRRPTTNIDTAIAEVISDEMDETGTFHCGIDGEEKGCQTHQSEQTLNQVYHNAFWGVLSNYKGFPVDCPQRDERQPWLGDRTGGCYGEAFMFDNNNLYAKWDRDIVEAQREDGCIPDVAPAFWNYYSENMTWPAALPFSMDMLYRQYGNLQPIERFYSAVKKWMSHMKEQFSKDGLITKDKYGDWCIVPEKPELIHSQDAARKTDGTLISTAYYYRVCRVMEQFATLQGLTDDAAFYAQEADATKDAFNKNFLHVNKGSSTLAGHILHPDSTFYGNNSLTSNLLPLAFGMIDDDYVKTEVEKNIIKTIVMDNGGTLCCGVIGIQWLMRELRKMGRGDIAWLLATNKKYPSWGYMAEKGATTIWELWNGDTANPAMNSGNHVMLLGDLVTWLYEDVIGIRAAKPGFKEIELRPDFSIFEMDNIEGSYNSIYGKIVSKWRKTDGKLFWHIEIPANTTAKAYLPDGSIKELGSGKYDLESKVQGFKGSEGSESSEATIVSSEFLYKYAPFQECHSATIAEAPNGDLVATYFGGTKERNPDVCTWVSRKVKGSKPHSSTSSETESKSSGWLAPQMIADGCNMPKEGATLPTGAATDTCRHACWNPIVYFLPDGTLVDYFKIGPNVAGWTGWYCTSADNGATWSERKPLEKDFLGPVKNKPIMNKGRIIAPTSIETQGWKLYFELSDDGGKTWRKTDFVRVKGDEPNTKKPSILAIQPTVLVLPDGRLEALCRTRSRYVGRTFSSDNGETWSDLELTDVPNNNSGLDAVTLKDGGYAMICNDRPIEVTKQKGDRTPLSILISKDGLNWQHWVTLEDSPISQYSYPSIIQTRDGHLHAIYTWRRQRVKHVELLPPTF